VETPRGAGERGSTTFRKNGSSRSKKSGQVLEIQWLAGGAFGEKLQQQKADPTGPLMTRGRGIVPKGGNFGGPTKGIFATRKPDKREKKHPAKGLV